MSELLLEAKNLKRDYKEGKIITPVLKGVNLKIYENELVAIVGSSGSGKSTLLHILGTLDTPTSGDIFFKGQDLFKLSAKELSNFRNNNLGFVYQFHHLLADFNALENVAMPLLIRSVSKTEAYERAHKLLERVGVGHRYKHRPSELSGGERQRVAIARAIIGQPSLILADEPTGNLDQHSAIEVFELLKELRAETKCSLVVVTHDLGLAQKFERTNKSA